MASLSPVSKRGRKGTPTPKQKPSGWQPLIRCAGSNIDYAKYDMTPPDEIYGNGLYSVFVRYMGHGALHISFHRRDRAAIRDWRHFQAIKNEVAGPERLAIEIFPPESALVDTANEYHLWVLPVEVAKEFPFMLDAGHTRLVMTPEEATAIAPGAKQRDWEEGIPTGLGVAP